MALNENQKRFCEEYALSRNATKAAIRAGYSEDTAYSQGQRLLKNVEISERIKELLNKYSEELNITFTDILSLEWNIANNSEKDSDRLKAADQISKKLGFYEKDNQQQQSIVKIINLGDGVEPNAVTS